MMKYATTLIAACALQGATAFLMPNAAPARSSPLYSEPEVTPPPASASQAGAAPSGQAGGAVTAASKAGPEPAMMKDIFGKFPSVRVEGTTLKTWDLPPATDRVQVSLKSGSRPIHSRIEYWHTPSYIPFQFKAYSQDGEKRPINCVVETPKHPKSIACYNVASGDFPLQACVTDTGLDSALESLKATGPSDLVQGGQIRSYSFGPEVDSVQVYMTSPERNMKALVELTQGPNSVKQTFELYCSYGYKTPFYAVIETPGSDTNTVRIVNQNTVEFPVDVYVVPHEVSEL